jgi:signal transduction histidine kinase
MPTPIILLILLIAAFLLSIIAISLFLRSEKEEKKLLSTEERLQQILSSEKTKLLSIIKSLTDGVIVVDTSFTPYVINEAAKKFLQISKNQPSFEDIQQHFPVNINLAEKLREAMKFNKTVNINEVKINDRTMQLFITPLYGNTVIGATILLQDLTKERSDEKLKEDFTNMIVHELRAPITAIKDAAGMLLKDNHIQPEDRINMLTLAYEQANKLLNLVNSILDAARIEQNRLILNRTISDIAKIAQDQVDLFLPEAKRKHISLIADISDNLPLISIDAVRITQVINNFLSNSLKYTNENGTVRLIVKTDSAYEKDKETGNIVVTISDNGIGIPKEKLATLFSKFGQIITSKTSAGTQKTSSGLGLYISKGIIEAHGGHIDLQSEVGKGTTFTFTLPVSRDIVSVSPPIISR